MAQLNLGIVASSETLTLEIESTLEQDIRKGQLTDDKIAEYRKLIKLGKVPQFREDEQGTVWFKKALGVVRSHYEVNFEALAEGYVVPEGVEDEVAMERVDALAADAAGSLAEAFEEFLFPDAVDAAAPPA
jgi:hypothetical protein